MIVYVENYKESTKELLELKVAGLKKVNIQNLIIFLYTRNEQLKLNILTSVLFRIAPKH